MGFAIDEKLSKIKFWNDTQPPVFETTDNRVVFKMRSFDVRFTYWFESNQLPLAPPVIEQWKIGIVQNVLFETAHYKYLDEESHLEELPKRSQSGLRSGATTARPGSKVPAKEPTAQALEDACLKVLKGEHKAKATLNMCFSKTVMDNADGHETALPFYSEPFDDSGTKTEPYQKIYHNELGFGFAVEKLKPKGERLILASKAEVSMRDRPGFWAPLRPTRSVPLIEARLIMSFGVWLVALDPRRRLAQVIAHFEPFSMMYTATLIPKPGANTLSTPAIKHFDCRAKAGLATSKHDFSGVNHEPKPRPGAGAFEPVLDGSTTSNTRGRKWNADNFSILKHSQ